MYHVVGNHNNRDARPTHLENVDFDTRYDPGTFRYSPQSGHPSDNASKHDDDSKSSFKSTTKEEPAIVNNWPVASQQVATMTLLRSSLMIFDTILASTPIMFIALALIAARLDGKEVSDYGARLAETLLLSPTIFPVIFAALMGRFFKNLGVYLAERGTTLGRLEQLVGCQSVFTALERQITLRSWSIVGLLSVLIWLLSPVGGQSALRLIGEESKTVSSVSTVRFLDPLNLMNSHMENANSMNSGRATFTSIFFAALLSSSKFANSSMDLWGNVKIPLYRHLVHTSTTEWKDVVGKDGYNATYGSLVGIPVAGMPSEGTSNFTIRARQFDVQCSKNEMMTGGRNDTLWQGMKSTWGMKNANGNFSQIFFREHPRPIYSISMVEERGTRANYSVATCSLDFIYVEAKVNCHGISCAVTSMRKLPLLEDGYTLQEDTFLRGNLIYNSMIGLPTVDNILVGSPTARGATNAEKWMMNPDDFIGTTYQNVALYKLDPELFATRLTIMWNTFYQSTFATTAIGGSLPQNLTQTGVIPGRFSSTSVTFNATQAAVVKPVGKVYKTNWKWFAALLTSSIILLIAAYVGLVLKYITLAPDIIGYASSLTMLNPYCPTPSGGTTLHGLERTALLHDIPIRIGDVCPNDSVGAIALAKTDDVNVARLDRQRWYI